MAKTAFPRKELYELVWSEPLKISGPAILNFRCRSKEGHAPERKFLRPVWDIGRKKAAGKKHVASNATRASAWHGRRSPDWCGGMVIGISGLERRGTARALFRHPPEFEEPIERVRERIAKTVGKVRVPREVRIWQSDGRGTSEGGRATAGTAARQFLPVVLGRHRGSTLRLSEGGCAC